ncbi:PulJ/GspJ family protein [Pseudothauera rhizosphaerae]|uniref:Type II secretion system protein J n=1 Tax=Pseudothauera rhizosphaerae TaxID=2565932 RepID=A0A4S4AMZ8_9RHOO|nr:prepilin-type N-terminal cleavage/methylation domain-containing protein [Pseudothauera rhizosphaerae]THF60446.1 prepilin-type N-terminal cleavage/methylation domain-containing protein [Pseudothauera rhizosphaerae]
MTLRRAEPGFSLIEVMIAIMIMALLSLIAWRGLDSMSRADTRLQMRTEESVRLMRALQQIERDLSWRTTVELPSPAAEAAASQEDGNGGEEAPRGRRAAVPVSLLPAGMDARRTNQVPFAIELVRAAPAAPGQWQRVQWWVQGGTLYRAAGDPAAAYPLPAPRTADRIAALDGVASFEVRAWEPGQGWRRLPAAGRARAAARGLEVTLGLRRSEGPVMQYRRVIPLG